MDIIINNSDDQFYQCSLILKINKKCKNISVIFGNF